MFAYCVRKGFLTMQQGRSQILRQLIWSSGNFAISHVPPSAPVPNGESLIGLCNVVLISSAGKNWQLFFFRWTYPILIKGISGKARKQNFFYWLSTVWHSGGIRVFQRGCQPQSALTYYFIKCLPKTAWKWSHASICHLCMEGAWSGLFSNFSHPYTHYWDCSTILRKNGILWRKAWLLCLPKQCASE